MARITRKTKRERMVKIFFYKELLRIGKHFFPDLYSKLKKVEDLRHPSYITYQTDTLLYTVLMKNILAIDSMSSMTDEFNTKECISNVAKALGYSTLEELPHHDTINDFLEKLDPSNIEKIRKYMINSLFKKRSLEQYRLLNKDWIIAIDATGLASFKERHCEHCLKKEYKNAKTGEIERTVYFHYVLEAKLVVGDMVLSIDTEFIENMEGYEKQDCEINAFKRLAQRLKENYKRLPICILGDSLYAVEPVFKICEKNNWRFVLVFKEGRTKSIWEEFQTLKIIENNSDVEGCTWVNGIDYMGRKVNVLESKIVEKEKEKTFSFITSIRIQTKNVKVLTSVGRSRWKIENEGFNNQKNVKNNIEHLCSRDYNAMKNHYLLAQIADIVRQLFENAYSLIKNLNAKIKEISSRLSDSFRRETIITEDILDIDKRIQIRNL